VRVVASELAGDANLLGVARLAGLTYSDWEPKRKGYSF